MDTTLQWFLNLFSTQELKAFIWLLTVTLAGTHTIKIIWRRWLPVDGGGHGHVALVAASISMIAAFFVWPLGSVPWFVAGVVGGPASNVAFKLGFALLKRFMPDLAATVNMDRRKDSMPIPPTGAPERRK